MSIRCIGLELCGSCISACPHGAVTPGKIKDIAGKNIQIPSIDRSKCDDCGKCADACTPSALYMCGQDYTTDEVVQLIERDIPFYEHSGGGVTLSGGECLAQPEFTLALLIELKERGINTAVDTTGYSPYRNIEATLPYTDLFLYDLKHMDSRLHKQVTGVPNELILENAKRISADGGKLQIRIPVIPMFNESEASFDSFGRFCIELGSAVERVQLLPYHKLGLSKYARLLKTSTIFEAKPPSDKLLSNRKEQLEAMGLTVIIH